MATGAVIAILFAPSFCGAPPTPMYPANFMKGFLVLRPSESEGPGSEDGGLILVSMANLGKQFLGATNQQ